MPRIYPPRDPELARGVGIPVEGEIFTADDADRLVGEGLAARRPADKKTRKSKPAAPAPREAD